jgi:hypothetical protein
MVDGQVLKRKLRWYHVTYGTDMVIGLRKICDFCQGNISAEWKKNVTLLNSSSAFDFMAITNEPLELSIYGSTALCWNLVAFSVT